MSDYVSVCVAPTAVPVNTGDPAADCVAAGGTSQLVPQTAWGLPELTLAEGGAIAGAILALWAAAWCIRQIANQVKES